MNHAVMVFLAGCLFGLPAIIIKMAYGAGFTAQEVIGAHIYFGLAVLLIFHLFWNKQKTDARSALKLALVGIAYALNAILFSLALETMPASLGMIIMFQYIWIGIGLEAVSQRQWPAKEKLISIPILLFGTLLATNVFGSGAVNATWSGAVLSFLAACSFALFVFFSSRVATNLPTLNRSLWINIGCAVIITIVYPPQFFFSGALGQGLIPYALALGMVAIVVAPFLLAAGSPKIGAGLAAILTSAELPSSIIFSVLILKEIIEPIQWMGVVIILAGIAVPYLVHRKTMNEKQKSAV